MRAIFVLSLFLLCLAHSNGQEIQDHPLYSKLLHKVKSDYVTSILQYDSSIWKPGFDPRDHSKRSTEDGLVADGMRYESEVHAAINPTDSNNIIVGVIDLDPTSAIDPLKIKIYYTRDFGENWQVSNFDGYLPEFDLIAGGGDPILVFDHQGRAILSWLVLDLEVSSFEATMGIYSAYSNDGGETWIPFENPLDKTKPFNAVTGEGLDQLVDKPWVAVDKSGQSGNIYIPYVDLFLDSISRGVSSNILVKRLTLGDTSYSDQAVVVASHEDFIFSHYTAIDCGPNGEVHVAFMGTKDSINFYLYHSISKDMGLSFSEPVPISQFILPRFGNSRPDSIVGIDPSRLYPCPQIVADQDPLSSRLFASWTANGIDSQQTTTLDIYYSISEDNGKSWSETQVISEDESQKSDRFYATLISPRPGAIVANYYDRTSDTNNVKTHYYSALSLDGGQSFLDQEALTSESSDFSKIGSGNSDFGVGEYNYSVATENQVIAFWADGRKNDGDINVYFAKVKFDDHHVSVYEVNGITDKVSIGSLHPNPVEGVFQFYVDSKESTMLDMQILSEDGRVVQRYEKIHVLPGKTSIKKKTSVLSDGIYFLDIKSPLGRKMMKFVKN